MIVIAAFSVDVPVVTLTTIVAVIGVKGILVMAAVAADVVVALMIALFVVAVVGNHNDCCCCYLGDSNSVRGCCCCFCDVVVFSLVGVIFRERTFERKKMSLRSVPSSRFHELRSVPSS